MPNFTGIVGQSYLISRGENNDEPVVGTYLGSETVTTTARGTHLVHKFDTPTDYLSPRPSFADMFIGRHIFISPVSNQTSENKNKETSENKTISGTMGGKRRRPTRRRRTTRRHR